ncbi:early endosome antigen 1 isoform X2 [Haplochromis burtoni]|uniref:early endosome antigen 1 isoform X2 n=1 Tax=Haplochromis burtoni TaxID=8153 RepID=UPI001C2D8F8E|nr:early endosome antigen 1 isoform X2 [Haplochromis burtoni]
MAGGSQFIWIPLLFTCVLCTSDPRAGHNRLVRTGNPDLDTILSRILLSTDFQNSPVNVTSIVIKTCTGVKETLEVLQRKLQQANHRYNQLGDEAFGLRTEVIQLKVELAACMSTASSTSGTYQPNLQLKMKQGLEKLDGDTLLLFKIMTLTGEVSTLQEKTKLATNSNRTADEIAELQKELDKTTAELKDQIQEAEQSLSNATLILQIISLQNQLWDLQEAETRGGKPNSGSSIGMTLVKEQLNRKIVLLQEKGDGYSANLLELIYVRTKIAELKRMIIDAIEKSKTFAADARKQWMQKIDLLRKLIIQLKDDENNRELTLQIMRVQAEVLHFEQLMRNAKNITDSQIQGFRVLLDREKQRHDVLQRQLEAVEYVKAQQIVQVISLIEEMKKQHLTGQPTTVRGVTEKKYIEAQAKIRELQRKLRLKTELDSKFVKRYEQVKIDFDRKIAELNRTEDFQPALIVKLMSLHDELKALKDQISLSEDKDLTSELRKQLERKQEELSSGIADIERLTSSPGAILKILELQHELWTLRNKATNGTTSDREEELQDRLDGFIDEINNRAGENTKLILKIISLQSQLEHLETLLSQTYNSNSPRMVIIRNTLTNELTFKRAELQKYINELNNKNPANARLILVIAELYKHLKRIERENRDDNAESSLTLTLLQMFLQNKNREYAHMKDKFAELERQLLLKTHECSGLEQQRNQLKTEVEDKIAELNKTKDFKTALLLNVINMKAEVRALKEQISNSKDPEIISQLQMQLEKKQDELITKTAEMEELIANPRVVLQILELQNEIWDLQNKDVNGTAGDQIKALQNRIDTLMAQIGSSDRDNTKLTLKILNLQSQVKHLQNLLSNRETLQTSKLTEITNELAAKKGELEKHVNELKEKNQENANLILNITDLQSQLENLEKVKTAEDKESAATISNLRKQLKVKEEEHSRDQEVILDLQQKLNETESCSDYEQTITDLQQNLNDKIKELQSKSSSVTSLALQISTLTQQVEQLKAQMNNSVSKSKVDELQKAIDEKNEELDKLTKELKERSTQPQRFLQIIALQTEIEKLVTVAENDTDDEKIKARQEELNSLIEGIKDEQNENIKLTFQILNQKDEIARLKKQKNRKNETQEAQIKDLEDQLKAIRNEIQQKTDLLDRKDRNIANLSAQIMELEVQIKELEDNIAALKEAHTESLADLQRRLKLKERQLDDTESQLEHIDAENYKYVMEIADLRVKLKKAVTQTSDKKIKDVEKKLKTQETKNKKLEAANKDLKQEVTELKMCCSQPPEECEDLRRDLQQCHDDADRQLQEQHQKDAKLNQLEQELQRQNRENNKLQNNIDRLQRELGNIEEKTIHTSKMTFDPDTAHPRIVLSDDETEMTTADFIQDVPNNPRRFDVILGALGATGFSSGKHYWEVSVAGKTCYHLGMTSESSRRKGSISFSPNNDYWTIVLDKQGQYRAIEHRRTIPIPTEIQPVTLGILLDYKKGTISFYDSGSRTHMYSFVGQHFTGKIYPFVNFCVEDGSAPNPVVLITPGATDWIK